MKTQCARFTLVVSLSLVVLLIWEISTFGAGSSKDFDGVHDEEVQVRQITKDKGPQPSLLSLPRSKRPLELVSSGSLKPGATGKKVFSSEPVVAVFNKAIIPLGSLSPPPAFNVQCNGLPARGRYRWIGTYIFRFDPLTTWPLNSDCVVEFREDLRAVDGSQPVSPLESLRFSTMPVSMSLASVSSDKLAAATSGSWTYRLNDGDSALFEVPDDAVLDVYFNGEVDLDLVRKNLSLRCSVTKDQGVGESSGRGSKVREASKVHDARGGSGESEEVSISLLFREPTPGSDAQHIVFSLQEPIPARASMCAVVLPKGAKFSPDAGALREDLRVVNLVGRQPFYVRLKETLRDVTYQTYEVSFPHGLEDPIRAIEVLKDLVVISPPQDPPPTVLLNPYANASMLVRVPTLKPEHSYLFSLKASDKVKDVYGQPLIGSSTANVTVSSLSLSEASLRTTVTFDPIGEGFLSPIEWGIIRNNQCRYEKCEKSEKDIDLIGFQLVLEYFGERLDYVGLDTKREREREDEKGKIDHGKRRLKKKRDQEKSKVRERDYDQEEPLAPMNGSGILSPSLRVLDISSLSQETHMVLQRDSKRDNQQENIITFSGIQAVIITSVRNFAVHARFTSNNNPVANLTVIFSNKLQDFGGNNNLERSLKRERVIGSLVTGKDGWGEISQPLSQVRERLKLPPYSTSLSLTAFLIYEEESASTGSQERERDAGKERESDDDKQGEREADKERESDDSSDERESDIHSEESSSSSDIHSDKASTSASLRERERERQGRRVRVQTIDLYQYLPTKEEYEKDQVFSLSEKEEKQENLVHFVTDRSSYKPGDLVSVAGVLRVFDTVTGKTKPPKTTVKSAFLSVDWEKNNRDSWHQRESEEDKTERYPLSLSPDGTFQTIIPIPGHLSQLGNKFISFFGGKDFVVNEVAVEVFVEVPRPPNYQLSASTEGSFVPVGSDFIVTFTAITATGEPATGVSLSHYLSFACENNGGFESETAKRIREKRSVKTDDQGKARVVFPIGKEEIIGNECSLSAHGEWFTPTGNLLTTSLERSVKISPLSLSLSTTISNPEPLSLFHVRISGSLLDENGQQKDISSLDTWRDNVLSLSLSLHDVQGNSLSHHEVQMNSLSHHQEQVSSLSLSLSPPLDRMGRINTTVVGDLLPNSEIWNASFDSIEKGEKSYFWIASDGSLIANKSFLRERESAFFIVAVATMRKRERDRGEGERDRGEGERDRGVGERGRGEREGDRDERERGEIETVTAVLRMDAVVPGILSYSFSPISLGSKIGKNGQMVHRYFVDAPFKSGSTLVARFGNTKSLSVSVSLREGGSVVSLPTGMACPTSCQISLALFSPWQRPRDEEKKSKTVGEILSLPRRLSLSRSISPSLSHLLSVPRLLTTSVFAEVKRKLGPSFLDAHITVSPVKRDRSLSLSDDDEREEMISPGDEVKVTVKLTDPFTKLPVKGTAIVWAVDKMLLNLRPQPLGNATDIILKKGIEKTEISPFSYSTSNTMEIQSYLGYWMRINETLNQARIDPWLASSFDLATLGSTPSMSPFMSLTSGYYKYPSSSLSNMGGGAVEDRAYDGEAGLAAPKMMMMMARSVPTGMGAPPDTASSPSAPAALRENFDPFAFPLWRAEVGVSGEATMKVKIPDSLTTYVVRCIAVSSVDDASEGTLVGSTESEFETRLPLSTFVALPRILRSGDVFHASVVVSSAQDLPDGIKVTLEHDGTLLEPAHLTPTVTSGNATFSCSPLSNGKIHKLTSSEKLAAHVPRTVPFCMRAKGPLGTVELKFTIEALGKSGDAWSDAVVGKVEVLGVLEPIQLGTSITLEGKAVAYTDALSLPLATPGSGTLAVSVSSGNRATVRVLAGQLISAIAANDPEDSAAAPKAREHLPCFASLAAFAVPTLLGQYPVREDAPHDPLLATALAATALEGKGWAANWVRECTTRQLGFTSSPPQQGSSFEGTVDVWANTFALFVARGVRDHVQRLTIGPLLEEWLRPLVSHVTAPAPWPETAAARAARLRTLGAELRYYLGGNSAEWREIAEALESTDKDLRSAEEAGALPLDARIFLALSALDEQEQEDGSEEGADAGASVMSKALIAKLAEELLAKVRYTGKLAYISDQESGVSLGTRMNALALPFLARTSPKNIALGKIAAHLAETPLWYSDYTTLLVADSLASWDALSGSSDPSIDVAVTVRGQDLLTTHLGAKTGTFFASSGYKPWPAPTVRSSGSAGSGGVVQCPEPGKDKEDKASDGDLTAEINGRGTVSLAASMRYTPACPHSAAIDRGIFIESILTDDSNHLSLSSNSSVIIGRTYTKTIQITVKDDVFGVVIVSPNPSGMETRIIEKEEEEGIGYQSSFNRNWFRLCCMPFSNPPQIRKDRVEFSAGFLRAGTHSVTYKLLAVTMGKFKISPIRAFSTKDTEVFGLEAMQPDRVIGEEKITQT